MDNSNLCQNRRSRRSNVFMTASVEEIGSRTDVKLRNLSSAGALIEGDDLPRQGSEVMFRRNELCVVGRVVWVRDGYAGIAFSEELEPEQVLRHVPAPRAKILPKHWRPGFSTGKMTPEEQRLAESWVWSPTATSPGE